jgi:hypothetical protein
MGTTCEQPGRLPGICHHLVTWGSITKPPILPGGFSSSHKPTTWGGAARVGFSLQATAGDWETQR